jgi:hypothetical protein
VRDRGDPARRVVGVGRLDAVRTGDLGPVAVRVVVEGRDPSLPVRKRGQQASGVVGVTQVSAYVRPTLATNRLPQTRPIPQISRGRPERGVCAVGPALPVRACHPASNHLITADSRSWGHDSTWLEWGHADLIPPAANQPAPINTIDVGARRVPGGAAASGPGERNLPRPPKSPIPGEKR